jgi:predicted NBD/HSP70 family sugar kinase
MATARKDAKPGGKAQNGARAVETKGRRAFAVGASSSQIQIIEALLENGSMSRSDLANLIGLSRSALTELSRILIDHGLIRESSVVYDKRKGRPSILLSLDAQHGYFVGVGLTEDPLMMVLTDCHGNVQSQYQMNTVFEPEAVATAIKKGIPQLLRATKIARDKVLGIGIALSGHINHAQGMCLHSNMLKWHDVPIAEIVQRVTEIPTYIDNDAHAVTTGQKLYGRARELKNFTIIMLGKKIGAGSYVHGRLYRGQTGAAGEIGHCVQEPCGPRCDCGKQGCLDVFASSSALLNRAAELDLPVTNIRELESLAANGTVKAIELLRDAGSALGMAAANFIQINNPELMLFTDLVGFGNGLFTTSARQVIEHNIMPHLLSVTCLEFRSVENNFVARGAASIAAHQVLIEQAGR